MANKIVIYTGSRKGFHRLLSERIDEADSTVEFLSLIRTYNAKVRASDMLNPDFSIYELDEVDNCIVRSDDFGSVLSHVISNFASIVSQSYDINTMYLQNPPKQTVASIVSSHPCEQIEWIEESYPAISKDALRQAYFDINKSVLGQNHAKEELIASLYEMAVLPKSKPSVILLYGPSGVGKTETAKSLSNVMGGKLTRIQFSMMQSAEAGDYIFGAEHSKTSFARDLLGRESNVILLDEFDKVAPVFYNAFYELFDEGRFVDTNYEVDMSGSIIVCTSNFASADEACKAMGPAMFSRIDACVGYSELETNDKVLIIDRYYDEILSELDTDDSAYIESLGLKDWFIENAHRYDNVRIMKTKLKRAVFGELAKRIVNTDVADGGEASERE